MPYHTAFAFLIPLLIGILGVYAQGRFETNIANIWIFLVNTLFYCFALVADLKYQHHQTNYSQYLGPVAIISGSLSSASIISILVGDVAFVIWAFVPVIVAYQHATALKNAYNLLLQKIKSSAFINMAYDWFKGSSSVGTIRIASGIGAVVGAISRNLVQLQDHPGNYISIYDQPAFSHPELSNNQNQTKVQDGEDLPSPCLIS
ncbi:hypothetical protein Patl1_00340 [Pistacia atlantica]|uniref:Uncharacterized protein n=1 Tax=Pistacia atlantica TaxID=434234 RepID=A0ACC1C953_9ROSI|nr:hypothetical protein Patl1_00340 [Pistacia atlantica]